MEFVFEIGTEDFPARFVPGTLRQLHDNFVKRCADQRISVDDVRVVGTPRRFALLVGDLADKQTDLEEERTGPPAAVAFRDGEATKAAEGFARGQGKSVDDLYTVATDKGEYVAVKVFEEGQPTRSLLPEILEGVMGDFNFPKSMSWGAYRVQFARPVRWLVAVAGGKTLSLEFSGVQSGNVTLGHRFAPAPGHEEAPSKLTVSGVEDYLETLAGAGVVVDPADRRAQVVELVEQTASEAGGKPVDDPGLVDEVTNLVEQPHAVLVEYDEAYLDLPDEVLLSSMRKHQRYFGVLKGDSLTNACVVVFNTPVRDKSVVAAGNLRVLKARLDDAKFFWEQDLKQPLEAYVNQLDTVLWLAQLGSMKDKSHRISKIAEAIGATLGLDNSVLETASRAGELCKADLVTQMVYEFPDLQGVMGREYALRSDESKAVAQAIAEQYLPAGADDDLPASDAGACVALAEKLDSLVGCFLIDLVPSSTADPYGLRRAAIGTIRILQDRGWTVSLDELLAAAASVYADTGIEEDWTDERRGALVEFLVGRLESQLTSDYPTDIVRAVLAVGVDDVTTVKDRVAALADFQGNASFDSLKEGFKRTRNILRKNPPPTDQIDDGALQDDEEKALREKVRAVSSQLPTWVEAREWRDALDNLAEYAEPLEAFFDNVMVMVDDEAVRANRLALLSTIEGQFLRIADLSVVS